MRPKNSQKVRTLDVIRLIKTGRVAEPLISYTQST